MLFNFLIYSAADTSDMTPWQSFQVYFLFGLMLAIIVGMFLFVAVKAFRNDKNDRPKNDD